MCTSSLFRTNYFAQDGMTALMWASYQGHSETVPLLLSAGVHVDLQDEVKYGTYILCGSDFVSQTVM